MIGNGFDGGFSRKKAVWILQWSLLLCLAATTQGQYRSPSIVEHPADVLVGRDEPATLNCHADGRPEPTVTWYKDGHPLPSSGAGSSGSRHLVLSSGDLFFLRVVQDGATDDTGTYWCVAANEVGSVRSNNATLEIAVLEDDFKQVPVNTRVAEGEVAMLECRPPHGSPPPVVTWTRDDRQLDPASNHRYRVAPTGELVITSARVGDSGRYACTARNAYATRTTREVVLTVLVKPHLVSSSGPVTTAAGATVELVCRVGGDPPPEVFWGRVSPPGAQLPLERLVQEERGQVLRLRHVSPEDRGVYSCTAENPVGIIAANTTLTVHSRPVYTKLPKDARVGVAGTARFECELSGSPDPTTYWTHEGSGLIVSSGQSWAGGRVSVGTDNALNIVDVKEEDTGFYACVGVGEAGSAIARAYLEVQGVSDMPPPIIAIGASNQTLPLGTEAELPCEAKGTPEPAVSWSFNGRPLDVQSSGRHSITPLGTLRIINLTTADTGLYTCTAVSLAGSSQWSAGLAVHKATNPNIRFVKIFWESDLPEPPQNLVVLAINTTQVTLGWSRGRSGSSSIRGHSVQYWSPDLRGQWRDGTTITPPHHIPTPLATTVTNLSPNTRYVFTVRSRNKDYGSRPSAFTHVIKTLDDGGPQQAGSQGDTTLTLREVRTRLTTPTVRLVSVEAISSTSLKVTWRLLVNNLNTLEGVYVRYRPLESIKGHPTGVLSVETIHFPVLAERSTSLTSSNEIQTFDSTGLRSPRLDLRSQSRTNHGIPTSHTISSLRPATSYEVFVVPFYRHIEGQPTSAMRRTTLPAPVLATPTGLHYRMVNESTARVGWDPLPSSVEVGGKLKGYNLQGVDVSRDNPLIHNSTTNSTFVFVPQIKLGSTYEFSVRAINNLGLGPPSEILRFTPLQEDIKTVPNNSIPSSTVSNNTYMIIAIVCAAILVFSFLLAAIVCIYRKRTLSKCPHYFSKGDGSSGPWSAYSGCWEDGSNTGGISTTRYTDDTLSVLNNARYADGTLGNLRYTENRAGGGNASLYTDAGGGQFYPGNDSKNGYEVRPGEDLMYEDPEGLRLVSFKGRHNQRCASPEPYATTPLITAGGEPVYPRSLRGGKSGMGGTRLPPNIPHMAPMDATHNFNTHSDKSSLGSGPVLQFPPPPPPPLNVGEGGGGSSSTTASTNSRGTNSNAAPSRGGSSQHLFMQHLPYHPGAGGSNSSASHHTSPLLYPRHPQQQVSNQLSPNGMSKISPGHLNGIGHHQLNGRKNQSTSPSYEQCQQAVNPFLHANNVILARNQAINNRSGLENWLSSSVGISTNAENGFVGDGGYPAGRCHSPQSSAMGDAEESDDKEGDESCWSETSHGTNENEVSTNGSASGSVSSLNPDLNWTEAVRLMSENKWPEDSSSKQNTADPPLGSVAAGGFIQFSNVKDSASDAASQDLGFSRKEDDFDVNRKLLSSSSDRGIDSSLQYGGSCENGANYYCQVPPEMKNSSKNSSLRGSNRPPPFNSSSKSSNKSSSGGSNSSCSGSKKQSDGSSNNRKHHLRKTSLTSPFV